MSEVTEKFRQVVRALDNKQLSLVPDFKKNHGLDVLRDDIVNRRLPEIRAALKKYKPSVEDFKSLDLPGLYARGFITAEYDYLKEEVLDFPRAYRCVELKQAELETVLFNIDNLTEGDLRPGYAQLCKDRAACGGEGDGLERAKLIAEEKLASLVRLCPTVIIKPKLEVAESVVQKQLRRAASGIDAPTVNQSFNARDLPRK